MALNMDSHELDATSGPARAKADNLVFLNIQKLDSLRTRRGEERTDYWDRALRGFGVRVYPTGRKVFTVRYTLHGVLRRKSLGIYRNARGVVGGEVQLLGGESRSREDHLGGPPWTRPVHRGGTPAERRHFHVRGPVRAVPGRSGSRAEGTC